MMKCFFFNLSVVSYVFYMLILGKVLKKFWHIQTVLTEIENLWMESAWWKSVFLKCELSFKLFPRKSRRCQWGRRREIPTGHKENGIEVEYQHGRISTWE